MTKMKADLGNLRANEYIAPSGKSYLVFNNREFEVSKEDVDYFIKKGFKTLEASSKKSYKKSTTAKSK